MTLIRAVIDRLLPATNLRQVQGALELAAALKAPSVATPAAFVVPMGDQPQPDEAFTGSVCQRVRTKVSIVLVVDNKRDGTGNAASDELELLRTKVRKALLGWGPPSMDSQFSAGPGLLIDMDNGRVWWADEYLIDHYWSTE